MPENTPNTVSVKVSKATYDALWKEQTRIRETTGRKPSFQEMLDKAWQDRTPSGSGNSTASAPAKEHSPTPPGDYSSLPAEVVDLFRRHWHDPRCKECVLSIGRIWDVGDEEIEDALARNCKQFKRLADALGSKKRDGDVPGEHPKKRMERAMERARRAREGFGQGEGGTGSPEGS